MHCKLIPLLRRFRNSFFGGFSELFVSFSRATSVGAKWLQIGYRIERCTCFIPRYFQKKSNILSFPYLFFPSRFLDRLRALDFSPTIFLIFFRHFFHFWLRPATPSPSIHPSTGPWEWDTAQTCAKGISHTFLLALHAKMLSFKEMFIFYYLFDLFLVLIWGIPGLSTTPRHS